MITGAGGLLGSQYTKDLISCGAIIVAIDNNIRKLTKLKKEIDNDRLLTISGDITKDNDWKKIVSFTITKYKKIDVLINNAEINPPFKKKGVNNYKDIFNISEKEITESYKVSILGMFLGCKHISKIMIKKKRGSIINIASDLSVIAPDHRLYNKDDTFDFTKPIYYSINKHAVVGLTKYLATYLCKFNIRVNAISPGSVDNEQGKEFKNKIKKLIPLNRMASKNEFSSSIIFLSSDTSSYMTGHNLIIDGGRSTW